MLWNQNFSVMRQLTPFFRVSYRQHRFPPINRFPVDTFLQIQGKEIGHSTWSSDRLSVQKGTCFHSPKEIEILD